MKSSLSIFLENWLARPVIPKMISFGLIGLGNTVIDLATFTMAYKVLALPLIPAVFIIPKLFR